MTLPEYVSPNQLANARAVITAVYANGGTKDDAIAAIVCCLQESSLVNFQIGDHGTAYGLFQQHPNMGWGTVDQCEDPAHSASSFLHGAGTNKGLFDVPNRSTLTIAQQVQTVQESANGLLYEARVPLATAIVTVIDPSGATVRHYRFLSSGTPDYSVTAAARGWGAGWPTDRLADMTTFTVPTTLAGNSAGSSKWAAAGTQDFQMHHSVAQMLHLILNKVQAGGYHLISGWCWGYGNRAIAGTNSPSNHSWGLAVDLNAPDNPIKYDGTLVTDMPSWVVDLFAKYGWAWGGDYVGNVHDGMHYEFMGTTSDAVAATHAAEAELGGTPPEDDMTPAEHDALMKIVNALPDIHNRLVHLETRSGWLMKAVAVNTTDRPADETSVAIPPYSLANQLANLKRQVTALQKSVALNADGSSLPVYPYSLFNLANQTHQVVVALAEQLAPPAAPAAAARIEVGPGEAVPVEGEPK